MGSKDCRKYLFIFFLKKVSNALVEANGIRISRIYLLITQKKEIECVV